MAKIKAVKFHSDFCESGKIKYAAGATEPLDDDTHRCVALNFAEIVTIDDGKSSKKPAAEPVVELAAESADTPVASEQALAEQAESV